MTDCTGTLASRYLEQYIQGTLSERESQKFEEHFFGCPSCLAQVEALQVVALKLGGQPRKMPKTPIPWPVRGSALAALAAMMIIGFLGFRVLYRPAGPSVAKVPSVSAPGSGNSLKSDAASLASSTMSRLADLTLPAFQPPNLRGQNGDPHFSAGMKAYNRLDCRSAVDILSQVPAQDDDSLAAQFYIGVCQMQLKELAAASSSLRNVDSAGDSPQQEAALYYLAQIALARNDSTTARHYLARTISLRGDFLVRARAELAGIPAGGALQ
ncbi:MAG: zf-HC2 domain-containing protein [Terracidiphilus sp.]|jgi:tetratricopeptide (TPR) repeat protein